MIEEGLMVPGRWDLRLKDSCPRSVLDQLVEFGWIIVTPSELAEPTPTSATALALARYTGVVQSTPPTRELHGFGLLDALDRSYLQNYRPAGSGTKSFFNWVNDLLPANGITAGTITATGANVAITLVYESRRAALDAIMKYYNAEFVIHPDGTLDAGTATALFGTIPATSIVLVNAPGARSSPDLTVIPARFTVNNDVDDYVNTVYMQANNGTSYGSSTSADSYKTLTGGALEASTYVQSSEAEAGSVNTWAAQERGRRQLPHRDIRIESDVYDITGLCPVGSRVYLYDLDSGLFDLSAELTLRGEMIRPYATRVMKITRPILRGHGVYYRTAGGSIINLTPWVEFETGPARLEISNLGRTFASVFRQFLGQ